MRRMTSFDSEPRTSALPCGCAEPWRRDRGSRPRHGRSRSPCHRRRRDRSCRCCRGRSCPRRYHRRPDRCRADRGRRSRSSRRSGHPSARRARSSGRSRAPCPGRMARSASSTSADDCFSTPRYRRSSPLPWPLRAPCGDLRCLQDPRYHTYSWSSWLVLLAHLAFFVFVALTLAALLVLHLGRLSQSGVSSSTVSGGSIRYFTRRESSFSRSSDSDEPRGHEVDHSRNRPVEGERRTTSRCNP